MTRDTPESLTREFASELPRYLEELQTAWQGPTRGTQVAMQHIQRIAHNLVGSAGAYGFPQLAEAAAQVVQTADQLLANFGQSGSHLQERLHEQLNALGVQLANPLPSPTRQSPRPPRDRGLEAQRSKRIVVVDDDLAFSRLLASEMLHFGFQVDCLDSLTALPAYLAATPPDLIVMDVRFPEGPNAGPQAIETLNPAVNGKIPVIFISAADNITSRLSAVRANGQAFFVKPFDVTEFIDAIERLLDLEQKPAYRILVVEDAASLSRLYASTLEAAGMIASVVNRPLEVLEVMENFHPDLILMDIYMPEVSGIELARIIQQHRAYLGVPLVFLSAERDPAKQLAALGHGGDNFLVKPIDPTELVKAVSVRAGHYQTMRALMLKDSMTGLLNHSRLLEQLDHELRRAARLGNTLSVAMIDIDHFKSVNDAWGHAVGDHVILTLARLLRERLRSTDIVGRYGGEEFLVVMPDTEPDNAWQVIETLRQSFEKIPMHAGGACFNVTFSAGLATAALESQDRKIVEKADAALYEAKRTGRNRIYPLR